MPLTREFKETVQARASQTRTIERRFCGKGVECLLTGDLDTGKANLRDYINATIGFNELSGRTLGERSAVLAAPDQLESER